MITSHLIRRCLVLLADAAGQSAAVQKQARQYVLAEAQKAGLS